MAKNRLLMSSYTYAVKAEKLLKTKGIACDIERNEDTAHEGCGYSVRFDAKTVSAEEILKSGGIPFRRLPEKGVT